MVVGAVDCIVVLVADVEDNFVVLLGASVKVDGFLVVLVVENIFVVDSLDEIVGLCVVTFSVKDVVEERDVVDSVVVDSCFELDISVVESEDETTGWVVVSDDATTLLVVDWDEETTLLVVDWDDGTACCVVWVSDDDGNLSVVAIADVGLGVDTIVVVTCGTSVITFGVDSTVMVATVDVVDGCCCFVVE